MDKVVLDIDQFHIVNSISGREFGDLVLKALGEEIHAFIKISVIAEGVETLSQLQLLKDLGCDIVQGYYFSRPIPATEFEEKYLSSK